MVVHRTGVAGVSWRHRRAEALAEFTIARDERAERLPRLAAAVGVRELVYIATCNRVEFAFVAEAPVPMAEYRRRLFAELRGRRPAGTEAEQALRLWQGEGAAEHLFLTTAGLDSARVGESEVTGQVREAIEVSRELGLLGPRLEYIFGEALRVAKRVRPLTEGKNGKVSLSDIALRHARERLQRTPGTVALIGISPMTEQCARALAADGVPVLLVNRTLARAEALAGELGAAARGLAEFRRAPDRVEVLLTATGAPEPVLARGELERLAARTDSGESPLILDLGVPPDVDPDDARAADVPRIGMREISAEAAQDRDRLLLEFADARALVDAALTGMRRHAAERLIGPMIAQLRLRYRHTALEGVERLFERDLAGVGEREREVIRRWAETLARRFAHVPSLGLRDLAFEAGPVAVATFFGNAEPELARALLEAADHAGMDMLDPASDGA
jgi:glutamyl-tRNA reductase